ncbi:unnamed protein product [Mucor fragilis]
MKLRCDVASNTYKHTDTDVFETIRPDFLLLDHETKLVAVEVKPFNSSQALVEKDKVRVAELSNIRNHGFSTKIMLSLEALIGFKNLVLSTLPTEDEMMLPYLPNVTVLMKPTTLYLK